MWTDWFEMTNNDGPLASLKVLLSAYSCNPAKGSEPGVGWNWLEQAARFVKVFCVTRSHNRPEIEAEIERRSMPNVSVIYFDLPFCAGKFKENTPGERLYYLLWHMAELVLAWRLNKEEGGFDIVHHVTWNSFKFPGLLWVLPPAFVCGPLGGGELVPIGFERFLGLRGRIFEAVRAQVTRIAPYLPPTRLALRACRLILVANGSTERLILSAFRHKLPVVRELETGVGKVPADAGMTSGRKNGSGLRVLWAGVMKPRKGLPLLLHAIARSPDSVRLQVDIVGDGPERERWEELSRELGISNRTRFHGWMEHSSMSYWYRTSDVLVFTSLRDTSGNVVLEAMKYGIPVVAMDTGQGVSEILGDDSGILISVDDPHQAIEELAEALQLLDRNPLECEGLVARGLARIDQFKWAEKGRRLAEHYHRVLRAR